MAFYLALRPLNGRILNWISIFLMCRYHMKLTLVSLFVLPLFFEVSRRSVGTIRTTSLGTMETSAKMRGKIQETLSGIEVVKTFAKEGRETTAIKGGLRNMQVQPAGSVIG